MTQWKKTAAIMSDSRSRCSGTHMAGEVCSSILFRSVWLLCAYRFGAHSHTQTHTLKYSTFVSENNKIIFVVPKKIKHLLKWLYQISSQSLGSERNELFTSFWQEVNKNLLFETKFSAACLSFLESLLGYLDIDISLWRSILHVVWGAWAFQNVS